MSSFRKVTSKSRGSKNQGEDGGPLRGRDDWLSDMGHMKIQHRMETEAWGVPTSHKDRRLKTVHGKLPSEAQQEICNMMCMMIEIKTIEGGQKNVLLWRTNIKKLKRCAYETSQMLILRFCQIRPKCFFFDTCVIVESILLQHHFECLLLRKWPCVIGVKLGPFTWV